MKEIVMVSPVSAAQQKKWNGRSAEALFVVITLTTEFLYISIGGGYVRPYHLIAPIILLMLHKYIASAARSSLFNWLLLLLAVNFCASLLASDPAEALTSYLLLLANATIAIAVALIMIGGRITPSQVISIVVVITSISVVWSILQLLVYRLAGQNWGLSESQSLQIAAGFASGFRTEANTFSKYINVSLLLVFPSLYKLYRRGVRNAILCIFVIGLLASFTRAVLYTLPISIVVACIWYIVSRRGRGVLGGLVMSVSMFLASLVVVSSGFVLFSEYAAYKIERFFDLEEILSGGSSSTRLLWQQALVDAFIASDKSIAIGNGWGQVYADIGGVVFQAGGSDLMVFLSYGGALSGLFYLMFQLSAISSSEKLGRSGVVHPVERAYFQGVAFASLGLMITGVLNGSINAPEYWLVGGLAIHANWVLRTRRLSIIGTVANDGALVGRVLQ